MDFPPKSKKSFQTKSLQYLNTKIQMKLGTLSLQCTIALFILPPFASLYTYLYKSDSDLVETSKYQVIYGFSLVVFSLLASVFWRYKLKSAIFFSILKAGLNFLNIIGSFELFLATAPSELSAEEASIAQYTIIYPRVLVAILLSVSSIGEWFSNYLVSALVYSYILIRVAPSFIIGYSIGMATYGSLVLLYLFYNFEKIKEKKFLKMPGDDINLGTLGKLQKELLNGLPEGMVILNKQYKPVYMNSSMNVVLGTSNDEGSIMQRIKDLNLETILQEVQKQQESPLYNFSALTNSPVKARTPQGVSPEKFSLNFSETVKIYMEKSPDEKLAKPRASKIDLTIPSIYLDDLKQKRKVPRKLTQPKDGIEEFKDKESSILLDSSSPRIVGLNYNRNSTIKDQYENSSYTKIQVEHEKFKGHITIPMKMNGFIVFNLYGELSVSGESEYIALEIKYQEVLMDHQTYIFLVIGDSSRREKFTNLEESTRYKNLMFASISHEFRTPVNSVLGLLQDSLKELQDQKIVNTHIKPAVDNATMLLFLIDDMLDYSKVLINKLILSLTSFSVKDCVEEISDLFRTEALQKGLQLKVTILREVPKRIKSDKRRVQQILVNLLSNAMKFTQKGQVEIIVGIAHYNAACLKIMVKDTGIGLKPADTKRLTLSMNDGYVDRKVASSSSGVGMGLMMTQSLALALGPAEDSAPGVAGINVDSQYGRGSTFEFVVFNHEVVCTLEEELNTVPTMPEEHSPQSKKSTAITTIFDPKTKTNFSRPNFASTHLSISPKRSLALLSKKSREIGCICSETLIVDDSSYNIHVLQTLLKAFQIKADTAFDGKEAVEKAITKSKSKKSCGCQGYKMIFMDYNMPIMDGCTATSELKRLIDSKEIAPSVIVGCTAYDDNTYMDQGLVAGMSEFITKPVSSKVLEDLLKRYDLIIS